ncbi:RNA polymerase sigma factor [Pararhodonellum marinum]|uniref:RNA polymerase sigma factor n=1 Tax=Pararhodonellum marinum TaxID=2755358 RepID=UPI00188F7E78|nr:RNA polymerase sigma factor [Pararhodonellum marinum]
MKEKEQKQIFEKWLIQYRALVFKIVKAYANSLEDQDDLFQEISIQLWHSISSFKGESTPVTWIYRISLNTAIKWSRKSTKHQHDPLEKVEHVLQESQIPIDPRLDWLYAQIHQLDEIDRSLALLLLDDFSYKEMSNILGISESYVGVKINRIKKQLISKLNTYNNHEI